MGAPDSPSSIPQDTEHPEEQPSPAPRGVCVYNVNPGVVTHQYSVAMMTLLNYDASGPQHIVGCHQKIASSVLSIARSGACSHFIQETTGEWMLFFDSDIEMAHDTVDTLLEVAHPVTHPIVSGLYLSALPEGLSPVAWGTDGKILDAEETVTRIEDGERLVECNRVGAGCLMVHRDVLVSMYMANPQDPWYGEYVDEDGVKVGEDFTFCDRARALHYPIYLDLNTNLGHVKTIILNKSMLGNVQITSEPV